jgi:hypothetical protein
MSWPMHYLPRSRPGTSRPHRAGWVHACATPGCSRTASPAAGGQASRGQTTVMWRVPDGIQQWWEACNVLAC